MQSLKDWVEAERKRLGVFYEVCLMLHHFDPDKHPLVMASGDWGEHYEWFKVNKLNELEEKP